RTSSPAAPAPPSRPPTSPGASRAGWAWASRPGPLPPASAATDTNGTPRVVRRQAPRQGAPFLAGRGGEDRRLGRHPHPRARRPVVVGLPPGRGVDPAGAAGRGGPGLDRADHAGHPRPAAAALPLLPPDHR